MNTVNKLDSKICDISTKIESNIISSITSFVSDLVKPLVSENRQLKTDLDTIRKSVNHVTTNMLDLETRTNNQLKQANQTCNQLQTENFNECWESIKQLEGDLSRTDDKSQSNFDKLQSKYDNTIKTMSASIEALRNELADLKHEMNQKNDASQLQPPLQPISPQPSNEHDLCNSNSHSILLEILKEVKNNKPISTPPNNTQYNTPSNASYSDIAKSRATYIQPTNTIPPTQPTKPKREISILIDSNRKNIDFRRLFPGAKVNVIPSGTLEWARTAVGKGIGSPTDVILHVGTNDIDSIPGDQFAEEVVTLSSDIQKLHRCNVYVSEVLPRGDMEVTQVNSSLRQRTRSTIPHHDITNRHLHDPKHLNRYRIDQDSLSGSQLFARDLYKAVQRDDPARELLDASRRWKPKNTGDSIYKNTHTPKGVQTHS